MATLFGGGPTLLPALASAWCPEYPDHPELDDEHVPPPSYDDAVLGTLSNYSPYSALLRQHSGTNLSRLHTPSSSTSLIPSSLSPTSVQNALRELAVIASFGSHQVRTLASGIHDIVTAGSARPAWNYAMHLGLHIVRSNLAFQGATIPRLRFWSNAAGGSSLPAGVELKQIKFTVDRDVLLGFENAGAEYRKGRKAGQYPTVSPEIADEWNKAKRRYELDGEWIQPTPPSQALIPCQAQSSSWLGSWFGQTASASTQPTGASSEPSRTQVIYYLHGGAYIAGSPQIYRNLTGRVSKGTNTKLFALRYRLAPEAPFPAALHDAFAGYLYLINPHHPSFRHLDPTHAPVDPKDIVFMGDSAGGGLALSLLNYLNLYLRSPTGEHLVPLPGGAVLLSPWVDLTFTSHSWHSNGKFDWLPAVARDIHSFVAPNVPHPVYMYFYGESCTKTRSQLAALTNPHEKEMEPTVASSIVQDRVEQFVRHPLVSPIFAETMAGLPPILIQAGDAEVLRDDSLALAFKYDADNVGREGSTGWVRHELYQDMVHVFIAVGFLKESTTALTRINRFLEELDAGRPLPPIGEVHGVLIDTHVGI
ncbi:hypothetical protein PhCBS80983_g02956 [Powellomyces hirtus]|uniref:Alpha/beta hydrolase fold-3 domain-containing protein n=1 Tax=Powellomyces hirtus TaxID=109895 RepID=A0A507E4S8_9FUNG|nr:hypothetical protein PhCBS80983_g02956 [Powellomyces hirtus]